MVELWIAVGAIALIGAVVGGGALYNKWKKSPGGPVGGDERRAGAAGAVKRVKRYAALNDYQVVAPALYARGGKTAEFDCLLVGYFGVLAVRCIGYNGKIYGAANEDTWVQTKGDDKRFEFANPLKQNADQARLVRDVLLSAGCRNVPVETVLVFTGSRQQLLLPRSTPFHTPKTLAAYLRTSHFDQDKKVDVQAVAGALRAAVVQPEVK